MSVAVLTQSPPFPPDSGSKIRNLLFLESLSRQGPVHLVTLSDAPLSREARAQLEKHCASVDCIVNERGVIRKVLDVLKSLATGIPYLVLANSSKQAREALLELIRSDKARAIQVQELCMLGNVPERAEAKLFLDAHNAEAEVQSAIAGITRNPIGRLFFLIQAALTARFEANAARDADAVFCVSESDERYFTRLGATTALVPNALNPTPMPTSTRARRLIFTGTLRYQPNYDGLHWFLSEMWPRCARLLPDLELHIVARDVPTELRVFGDGRIRFHENVDVVEPFFRSACVMIVPLRAGGGTRYKILQAFANGLPVVSTSTGASGLDASDGKELLLRDDPGEFADAVVSLVNDERRRAALAESAHELLAAKYSWDRGFRNCLAVYGGHRS